jgi:glucose/arabinose dehydrogenase
MFTSHRLIPVRLTLAALLGAVFVLLACAPANAAPTLPTDFTDSLVAGGIDRPTDLAFTPDRRLLIAAEGGTLRVYKDGALLGSPALDISPRVCSDGERGVMSVAVDPSFSANHYVYLYYTFKKYGVCDTAPSTQTPVNRISRFVLNDDNTINSGGEVVLVDNIPAPQTYHIGADLNFGKDGYLYISTGDGGCNYTDPDWCDRYNDISRNQNVLLGKILRVTRDGGIPSTNPYLGTDSARCNLTGYIAAGKKCQETYAWGLRNPFRVAFDPNAAGTRFFINDVGDITWEEIDVGQAGADYGWNVREGHCATASTTDCGPPPAGMTNPIFDYVHDYNPGGCMSITGGAFVPNGVWPPDFDGSYLYADLTCGKIFKLDPASGGGYASTEFARGFGDYSLISTTFGPYGASKALYYITWNAPGQEVRRIAWLGYRRPASASPLRTSLVPVFTQCGTPANPANAGHAAPLSAPSCSPPAPTSNVARVGASAVASASFTVLPDNPTTTPDESDVSLVANLTDVQSLASGDYNPNPSGADLTEVAKLRLTDTASCTAAPCAGAYDKPATTTDVDFSIPIDCAGTADPAVGATCAVSTTADTLMPGFAKQGRRAVLQVFRVRVSDSGANGIRSDSDDRLFAQEGLFAP